MFWVVKKCDQAMEKMTTYMLVFCVLSMLSLSSLNIILRWFHHNITWIDPFVRHLVFFSAFLGGIIATGQGTHIGIDILGKFVETKGWHKLRTAITQFIYLVSIFVLCWMIKAGIDFTRVEMEFSKEEFWGISSGYLVMLIPIGLGLLGLRFFLVLLLSFQAKAGEQV
jgi:TRAP-type C4-dicarboxylate transport system permease small subunit